MASREEAGEDGAAMTEAGAGDVAEVEEEAGGEIEDH